VPHAAASVPLGCVPAGAVLYSARVAFIELAFHAFGTTSYWFQTRVMFGTCCEK